jgi:diaminopimelate decarboxylase
MSDMVSSIVETNFGASNGELLIGRVPVTALAEQYGTPLFAYDRTVIDAKLDALRRALPSQFSIFYSVKANPNLTVLRHFLSRGCGLEIASGGELELALEAGCAPKRILFAGPGKTEAELEFALSRQVGEIHLESLVEAKRIASISERLGIRANVAVRVNPAAEAEGGAMRMGGRPTPFGIDEEVIDEALDAILANPSIDVRGIHLFAGTQILDAQVLANQYRHGLGIAKRVARKIGGPLRTLDFGGGLGIPYFAHENSLDLEKLQSELSVVFGGIASEPDLAGTQFVVEPGRYLVGEAGVYLTRINDIKISRGKKFLVLDGGMNHHLAASGNLGQTIKRNYPVAIADKLGAPPEETVDVVGPLCTPLDTLARSIRLPHAKIGDLFVVFQSGAYGRSASPLGFLSHAAPSEIWVDDGNHKAIHSRTRNAERCFEPLNAVPVTRNAG